MSRENVRTYLGTGFFFKTSNFLVSIIGFLSQFLLYTYGAMFTLRNRFKKSIPQQSYDSEQDTDLNLGQEFDDLIYDNSEDISMCNENRFNTDIDCCSNYESELISTNIDDLPKIFDGTKSDFNWNYECSFEPFNNFTNLAMFIWVTKYMTYSIQVYYFSLIEHLQRILKNPSLSSQLYFEPGIFSKSCEELWEGNLWAESPFFGQPNLSTAQ
ncbi:10639_t:CDS:2, partial [Dentiscutata heterogama]